MYSAQLFVVLVTLVVLNQATLWDKLDILGVVPKEKKLQVDTLNGDLPDFGISFKEKGCESLNPRDEDEICICMQQTWNQNYCYYAKVEIVGIRNRKRFVRSCN